MSPAIGKPLQGNNVLIVEDDPFVAFDVSAMLRDAGAEVVGPVMTLKDAEALALSAEVTCGFLDVRLDNDFVFPVAKILQERGIRFVFYTGYANTQDIERDWPQAQILTKPASRTVLVRAVRVACGLAS